MPFADSTLKSRALPSYLAALDLQPTTTWPGQGCPGQSSLSSHPEAKSSPWPSFVQPSQHVHLDSSLAFSNVEISCKKSGFLHFPRKSDLSTLGFGTITVDCWVVGAP